MPGLLERLSRWKLLREDAIPEPRALHDAPHPQSLLRLCDAGALEGGLSVALDVRPDELVGALCERIGGGARRLKVLDVREREVLSLELELPDRSDAARGARSSHVESWEVPGTEALVDRLDEAFAGDKDARAVAVLGEWNEMWQLWCVPKARLPALLSEPWFAPHNRGALLAGVDH